MGFRMFYRVDLFLDGIPDHAWTPTTVECVIGHRCALQYIFTDLVQPEDTRHIELWAWTQDPRDIPKKVWLAFTHGPAGGSSAIYVDSEPPPAAWYQGNRYAIFVHLSILEDYKAVEGNLQAAIDNPASVKPICDAMTGVTACRTEHLWRPTPTFPRAFQSRRVSREVGAGGTTMASARQNLDATSTGARPATA
jgi:hypothetical protein